MKRLIPLLFPLSLWAQSLSEMGFYKVELSDTLIEILDRWFEFDNDSSSNFKAMEYKWAQIYINYMEDPTQLSYIISKNGKSVEIFFILIWDDIFTRTKIDWVIVEDKSKYLYDIATHLPSKYKII